MGNKTGKKSKKKIIWIIAGSVVMLLILKTVFSGKKETIVEVQTELVAQRNITQVVSATGKINPVYQVVITPEVTGEIVALPVKEGDVVKKGQILIKIKPDTYAAQRDRARAQLESAKSTLKVREAQHQYSKSEFKRKKELYEKSLIAKQEMDQVKSELDSQSGLFDSQRSIVLQTEATLKEAIESLNKTSINSPMDGTISKLNVELGERVLGSGFSQGTDIMTVADLGKMEANVEVDENDVVLVSIGDIATVELDAVKNKKFTGQVAQIGNSAKTSGRGTQEEVVNFEVKIALREFDERIRPGMSCNADIETDTKNNVLAVPIQSVTARTPEQEADVEEENRNGVNFGTKKRKTRQKLQEMVFVVKNNEALIKNVTIGISDDTFLEIKKGLKEGEVVVSGPYRAISRQLKDKIKVVVKNRDEKGKEN